VACLIDARPFRAEVRYEEGGWMISQPSHIEMRVRLVNESSKLSSLVFR
jgi:hypothetical protein